MSTINLENYADLRDISRQFCATLQGRAAGLHDPDVPQGEFAAFRKRDPLFGFLPGPAEVVGVAQVRSEEVSVISGKEPCSVAPIDHRVKDAMPCQKGTFTLPCSPVARREQEQAAFGSD